jgi:hypothetical protein
MKSATKMAESMLLRPRDRRHIGVVLSCQENEAELMREEPVA